MGSLLVAFCGVQVALTGFAGTETVRALFFQGVLIAALGSTWLWLRSRLPLQNVVMVIVVGLIVIVAVQTVWVVPFARESYVYGTPLSAPFFFATLTLNARGIAQYLLARNPDRSRIGWFCLAVATALVVVVWLLINILPNVAAYSSGEPPRGPFFSLSSGAAVFVLPLLIQIAAFPWLLDKRSGTPASPPHYPLLHILCLVLGNVAQRI